MFLRGGKSCQATSVTCWVTVLLLLRTVGWAWPTQCSRKATALRQCRPSVLRGIAASNGCRSSTQEFHEVFPHLITAANVPKLVKTGDVNWDGVDAAFCCLPHATTQVCGSQCAARL